MEQYSKGIVQKAQPYLKSGKGTESRQQASQSSRRYIPKGGFVIDFTTQPLPKGKGRAEPNGCYSDVPREVLIARQQRAAARLSAPKHSAGNSPASKKLELPDLEFPDHPKPWGASRCKAALKENIGPHLTTIGHAKQLGSNEKVSAQARPSNRTVKTKISRVDTSYAAQQHGEMLDDKDIFDDDAPLLSEVHLSKTPSAAQALILTDSSQAGAEHQASQAPVTSVYVRQLLTPEAPAPGSAVQKELLDLKAQITQAAAVLELEKQAFLRSRAEDETAWREATKREERRLQREKAILSRQSQVLLKLPSKREKAEVDALSAALEEERRTGCAKDARHKLTVQRLQRHVTRLQGKVAELEDEVRWHSRHAANAARLPTRTGQLHSSSQGVALKPEQDATGTLPEGASLHDRAAKAQTLKQRIADDSSGCQQPTQLLSSRPATPEHPEQQLCSSEPPRKQSRTGAAGVPGLHQAVAPPNATAAQGSSPKAVGKEAEGNKDYPGIVPDRVKGVREAPGDRQKPLAVSWQIECARSRGPISAQPTPAKGQRVTGAGSTSPKQPCAHDSGVSSPSSKGHADLADIKLDGSSVPAKTGPAPASHLYVQSALRPSERPKARTLPPLPDFMSLEAFRSPSYSQDMPRMEALYAAADRASAFPDKPQAEATYTHHSSQMQDAKIPATDRPCPSSREAAQLRSRLHGTAIQPEQTPGAPLCTALHGKAVPGSAATGICIPQHCSTEELQDESKGKSWILGRPASPRLKTFKLAASSSCFSADASPAAADASLSISNSGTAKHERGVQLSGCTATSADEYSSIKASLRTLQQLLDNPQSPTLISKHTEDTRVGSSLDGAEVRGVPSHGSDGDASVTAQKEEQPNSQPSVGARHPPRDASELPQDKHGLASSSSQEDTQLNGCTSRESHKKLAQMPDAWEGAIVDPGSGLSRQCTQQDMSPAGADGISSRHGVTISDEACRRQCGDGRITVRYKNGDCKCSHADGTVEYFYAKADTWHTTCPGGVEVYHFPSGQTEAHHPGGLKEIIFQDGSMRLVDGKGAESAAELDHLSNAVRRSRPVWAVFSDPSM